MHQIKSHSTMGKGIAKYGYKSGVLPSARAILKKPTVRQDKIIEKLNAPKPKGMQGVGYADGIKEPKGSHRDSPKAEFIDVENLIAKTIPLPKSDNAVSEQHMLKKNRADLRRKYLSNAFRKEEERLLRQEELLEKKERIIHAQREEELAELNKERSSNLTIPTLEDILTEPLMRQRTPEESEIIALKRKHNRELLEFRGIERKFASLVQLYHVSDDFIVTEEQLLKAVENVFASESQDILRNKLSVSSSQQSARNEGDISDALFGTLGNGKHLGLPIVKEFLSGEMDAYNDKVNEKLAALEKETEERKDSVL